MIIEKTLIDYLIAQDLPEIGWAVYPTTPKQPVPENYIIIDKTGARSANGITQATIAIQSISSESLLKAAQINEMVVVAMRNIASVENIFGAHLQTDYNFTNTATKQFRYQAVYDITYKR